MFTSSIFQLFSNYRSNLQELHLSDNNTDLSSRHYPNFPSLVILISLTSNQLTGEIPESIGLLYQLEYLYLEKNYLKGKINELHLANLSQLSELDLTDNSFSLEFATTWTPPFQLLRLGLGSCKLGPSFPRLLQAQSQLEFLNISDAGIHDFARLVLEQVTVYNYDEYVIQQSQSTQRGWIFTWIGFSEFKEITFMERFLLKLGI